MKATLRPMLIAACALLYGAGALADNTSPSMLSDAQRAALEKLVPEDMENFVIHAEPRPFRDQTFLSPEGETIDLRTFEGGLTLVNFWATWCPPCRAELPGMDRLAGEMGDEGLTLVAVSIDRGGLKKANGFWKKAGFEHIETYADPKSDLALQMGVRGIPVTAILGPDAREIGRLIGDAEWDSDEAKAMLRFLLDATGVEADDTVETRLDSGGAPKDG